MDRRTFLAWLGGAGAALVLPTSPTSRLADELPLMGRKEAFSVGMVRDRYVIPVRIDGCSRWPSEICETLIDRPVFGMKPRTLRITRLEFDGELTAVLLLDKDEHAVQFIDANGNVSAPFHVYGRDECADMQFVPREFRKDEEKWFRLANIAENNLFAQPDAVMDAALVARR